MIQGYKTKLYSRPVPAVQFDNFLKARSQKQSIIQSDSQPILSKVQSFYQLLKLTKTGQTINAQNTKSTKNNQLKNKSQSSKTITTFSSPNNNQYDFNRFDDIQSDQAQMKKLNKMVFGLSEWQDHKEKQSLHVQRKNNHPKTTHQLKRHQRNILSKQPNLLEEKIQQRKKLTYSSCDGKKFRNFYTPLKKHQAKAQLDRINSQFTKASPKINYPQSLLNCNLFTKNNNNFKQLKSKIKMLQNKAKNQYGLDFDNKNHPIERKNHVWNDSKDNSEEKQNDFLDFSELQLGPILNKEFPLNYQFKNNKNAHKQNTFNDTSIPKSLIDIVQSKSDSLHLVSNGNNKIRNSHEQIQGKLKKGYLSRPRTFKPTYTYVQI